MVCYDTCSSQQNRNDDDDDGSTQEPMAYGCRRCTFVNHSNRSPLTRCSMNVGQWARPGFGCVCATVKPIRCCLLCCVLLSVVVVVVVVVVVCVMTHRPDTIHFLSLPVGDPYL